MIQHAKILNAEIVATIFRTGRYQKIPGVARRAELK